MQSNIIRIAARHLATYYPSLRYSAEDVAEALAVQLEILDGEDVGDDELAARVVESLLVQYDPDAYVALVRMPSCATA